MDRVFLDANVLFSAAYRSDSGLAVLWRREGAALLTSAYAEDEARRNSPRTRSASALGCIRRRLRDRTDPGRLQAPEGLVLPADDQVIFLAAMAARATHLLTGDKTHFGRYYRRTIAGVLILPPSVYLRG